MSIGNLKDYGNKGNNMPWQWKMLQGIQAIVNSLTGVTPGQIRTPEVISSTGAGITPSKIYSLSIANVGTANGTVDGVTIPAGVTLNWSGELNNLLGQINYDATGTIFIITYTS